ncbi:MAG: beta-eliminating lyase-related protein, partial [Kiloniellales bacterium]
MLAALARANEGTAGAYGEDDWTARVEKRLQEVFEIPCRAFPVVTGTAANALSLSLLASPLGTIFCHEEAHIQVSECGAVGAFTGGATLMPLPGDHGKLAPETLSQALRYHPDPGLGIPAALSLTQITEAGTVYGTGEVAALAETARAAGMGVHMDGARFANALVALGCSPAEATWKAGVDLLSFGATKNGALMADAIVVFRPELAETLEYRRLRGGHLLSKLRFVSAQLEAYLADGLWLRLAAQANAMAKRLSEGLAEVPGVELLHPVEGNEIFCRLPADLAEGLAELPDAALSHPVEANEIFVTLPEPVIQG